MKTTKGFVRKHLFTKSTVKPLLSGHLRDLPKRFVKTAQCLLTINNQQLPCTAKKFDVVKGRFD